MFKCYVKSVFCLMPCVRRTFLRLQHCRRLAFRLSPFGTLPFCVLSFFLTEADLRTQPSSEDPLEILQAVSGSESGSENPLWLNFSLTEGDFRTQPSSEDR